MTSLCLYSELQAPLSIPKQCFLLVAFVSNGPMGEKYTAHQLRSYVESANGRPSQSSKNGLVAGSTVQYKFDPCLLNSVCVCVYYLFVFIEHLENLCIKI